MDETDSEYSEYTIGSKDSDSDFIDEDEYQQYCVDGCFKSICADHLQDSICEYCEKYYFEWLSRDELLNHKDFIVQD